jgi:hypothetical protein
MTQEKNNSTDTQQDFYDFYVKRKNQFKKYADNFYIEQKKSEEFPYGIIAINCNNKNKTLFFKHENTFHNDFINVKDIPKNKIVFDLITLGDGREVYWLHNENEMDLHPEDMYMCEYGFQEIIEGYIREGREYINYTEFDEFITGIEEEMKKEAQDELCEEINENWEDIKEKYVKRIPNLKHLYQFGLSDDWDNKDSEEYDERGEYCEDFIRTEIIASGSKSAEEYFDYIIDTYGASFVDKEIAKHIN